MSSFSVRKSGRREAFSVVQDALLEHPTLSLNARAVLAWMLGRPDGWEIQIKYMLDKLHITDNVWRTVKKDLLQGGFFSQVRFQSEDGKFTWVQEVTDEPLYIDKSNTTKNHPLKTTNGLPTHDKPRIEQDIYKQNNFTIPPPNPTSQNYEPEANLAESAQAGMEGIEIDYINLTQLSKLVAKNKPHVTSITSQALADALEASLRQGVASGNKVKFPQKIVSFLNKLSKVELVDWGDPVRRERERNKLFLERQINIEFSRVAKPDQIAQKEGERILQKARNSRQQTGV